MSTPPASLAYAFTPDTRDRRQFSILLCLGAVFAFSHLLDVVLWDWFLTAFPGWPTPPYSTRPMNSIFQVRELWRYLDDMIVNPVACLSLGIGASLLIRRTSPTALRAFRWAAWFFVVVLVFDKTEEIVYLAYLGYVGRSSPGFGFVFPSQIPVFLNWVALPILILVLLGIHRGHGLSERALVRLACFATVAFVIASVAMPVLSFARWWRIMEDTLTQSASLFDGYYTAAYFISKALLAVPVGFSAIGAFFFWPLARRWLIVAAVGLIVVEFAQGAENLTLIVTNSLGFTHVRFQNAFGVFWTIRWVANIICGLTFDTAFPAALILLLQRPQTRELFAK